MTNIITLLFLYPKQLLQLSSIETHKDFIINSNHWHGHAVGQFFQPLPGLSVISHTIAYNRHALLRKDLFRCPTRGSNWAGINYYSCQFSWRKTCREFS